MKRSVSLELSQDKAAHLIRVVVLSRVFVFCKIF